MAVVRFTHAYTSNEDISQAYTALSNVVGPTDSVEGSRSELDDNGNVPFTVRCNDGGSLERTLTLLEKWGYDEDSISVKDA